MHIKVKRAYDGAEPSDGTRLLVDGMWPRGVAKKDAQIHHWLKDLAPSRDLRQWFGHDPERWEGFKKSYFRELEADPGGLQTLREAADKGTVTLIFAAKDTEHNNAVALKQFLHQQG